MRYQLLGPLSVVRGGETPEVVDLGSPKQRMVLALLVINRGTVVSIDRLADAVWGDGAPPSATSSLQAYISNLRRALRNDAVGTSPIRRQSNGYILDAGDSDLDIGEFLDLANSARQAADREDWALTLDTADGALGLWRGRLLDGFGDEEWVQTEAAGLEEIRSGCRENRITALLALGRVPQALADVVALGTEQPYRDRSSWLHMMALHRAGRPRHSMSSPNTHAASTPTSGSNRAASYASCRARSCATTPSWPRGHASPVGREPARFARPNPNWSRICLLPVRRPHPTAIWSAVPASSITSPGSSTMLLPATPAGSS
jgi:DNA-binding SARP family transcriptional activator